MMHMPPIARVVWTFVAAATLAVASPAAQQTPTLPTSNIQYGGFRAHFAPDGTFTLQGQGWPPFNGTWKSERDEVTLVTTGGPPACSAPGRYRVRVDGTRVLLAVVQDECTPRRMILDASTWHPEGEHLPLVTAACAPSVLRASSGRHASPHGGPRNRPVPG